MFSADDFVADCRAALAESAPMPAVKELVDKAVSDPATAEALHGRHALTVLHAEATLTVVGVVIPPGAPRSLPHDHRMWAVVGICAGQEDNEFFVRREGVPGLARAPKGGRSLHPGDTLAMGTETVHSIGNPLGHSSTVALHVYGGDLVACARSMWTEPDWREEPYDAMRATGSPLTVPTN
jgi:predicted metal-dependent enzyme (double-stranded beta helix superfamily)